MRALYPLLFLEPPSRSKLAQLSEDFRLKVDAFLGLLDEFDFVFDFDLRQSLSFRFISRTTSSFIPPQ